MLGEGGLDIAIGGHFDPLFSGPRVCSARIGRALISLLTYSTTCAANVGNPIHTLLQCGLPALQSTAYYACLSV